MKSSIPTLLAFVVTWGGEKKMKLLSLMILSRVDIDDINRWLARFEEMEKGTSTLDEGEIEKIVWLSTALEGFGLLKGGPSGLELTLDGQRFLHAGARVQKTMIRAVLESHETVRDLLNVVKNANDQRVKISLLLACVTEWFPAVRPHSLLMGLLTWGRYAGLLEVDSETAEISVIKSEPDFAARVG
jgi:hypothetical protein